MGSGSVLFERSRDEEGCGSNVFIPLKLRRPRLQPKHNWWARTTMFLKHPSMAGVVRSYFQLNPVVDSAARPCTRLVFYLRRSHRLLSVRQPVTRPFQAMARGWHIRSCNGEAGSSRSNL